MPEVTLQGTYFDGMRAKAYPVSLEFSGETLYLEGEKVTASWLLTECTLEPPLGTLQRGVKFSNGARFETADIEAFEVLEAASGKGRGLRTVHLLESRWHLAVGCLVGLVVSVSAFVTYGIPFLAARAAYATPYEVADTMSQQSLKLLDRQFLEPSALEPEREAALQAQFETLATDLGTHPNYELIFRGGGDLGANALALPSGLIVMTDDLVELAEDDLEILGVLAHEIAHVELRHGLRSLYQGAGIFLLVSVLVGDVASVTSVAASLPTILVESGYSRAFEREADAFAGAYMVAQGWGTEPLQNILERLTGGVEMPALLSSHPGTAERLENLEALEP